MGFYGILVRSIKAMIYFRILKKPQYTFHNKDCLKCKHTHVLKCYVVCGNNKITFLLRNVNDMFSTIVSTLILLSFRAKEHARERRQRNCVRIEQLHGGSVCKCSATTAINVPGKDSISCCYSLIFIEASVHTGTQNRRSGEIKTYF